MSKILLPQMVFIGRPFPPSMMDDNHSFKAVNMRVEKEKLWQQFLKKNHLEKQRATLVEFAPTSFMYWYGVVTPNQLPVPKGLMKYVLPKAQVVQERSQSMTGIFDLPLNFLVQTFFKKVMQEGIKVYQNPGDSDTPFLLQSLNLSNKKLTQTWYLQVSH